VAGVGAAFWGLVVGLGLLVVSRFRVRATPVERQS
jgi:predicted benzoate:H+ symporter BenE